MKLIFTLAVLLPMIVEAQYLMPKNKKGDVEFNDIVSIDTTPSGVLYSRGQMFMRLGLAEVTGLAGQVNEQLQEIDFKGYIPVYIDDNKYTGDVQFSFTISCRNNSYAYTINNLQHYFINGSKYLSGGGLENDQPVGILPNDSWRKVKISTANKINSMIYTLKNFMNGINLSEEHVLSKN